MDNRQLAYKNLIILAEKQGYVTFDDIMDCADEYSLPIQDFDWLSNSVTTRGIIVYNETPSANPSDDEADDYAQSDYDLIYERIISLCPSLDRFVSFVRSVTPPQRGEVTQLKYQVIDGNSYARKLLRHFEVVRELLHLLYGQRAEAVTRQAYYQECSGNNVVDVTVLITQSAVQGQTFQLAFLITD